MSASKNILASSGVSIEILVVADTAAVKAWVAANGVTPSTDSANPTLLPHNFHYMIANDPRGIVSGQGTGDLNFMAQPRDEVHFYGTSIEQNADDAIIVYNVVPQPNQPNVFGNFQVDIVTLSGAVSPTSPNGLPVKNGSGSFASLDAKVSQQGTEAFLVYYGLYQLDSTGENQVLYGYFGWDPVITVS
jgi:hypothetical protein